MKRLLIASNNEGKIKEVKEIFAGLNYTIISMKDLGVNIQVIEDQPDFAGNSFKKASEVSRITGEIVLADDSGLEVKSLKGQPGVFSARFAGINANDDQNNRKLLSLMKKIPERKRGARFRCVITVYLPGGTYLQTEGICPGKIGYMPMGEGGFGYDPVFIPDGFNKSMAELTVEEKNNISHRAFAIKAMLVLMQKNDYCSQDN